MEKDSDSWNKAIIVLSLKTGDTNKEAWVLYRQELRDFPALWVEGMEFPTKPE